MPDEEYVGPLGVKSKQNEETGLFEIIDVNTGQPALTKNGKRMDGGGNQDGDVSGRQAGHIQDGIDKKVEKQLT